MFNKTKLSALVAALALTGAAQASAEISGNVSIVSDYAFRGISQTAEKGAIQGGFDYAAESGFYAGTWMSNVEFGTESSTEMDLYFGYAGSMGDLGYDVSYIYFDYEGDAEFDYQEYAVAFSYGDFSFGVNYSSEYLGDGGPDFLYPYVGYSMALTEGLSLDLHYGYSDIDAADFWGPGEDSYTDYSATLGFSAGGVDFGLAFVGTDLDDGIVAGSDDRLIFSISKSL
jgi:uncharacterized protein (TIGR02001 family)